ncbi:hypothetical protein ACFXQA_14415 [Microbacterium sp. P07]|uniref:hypothetical protein n=1 Tax=Microbacterium sp. P07 TaxID=3366952 RepID=UPI00374540E3
MTTPHSPSPYSGQPAPPASNDAQNPRLLRWAIWVAIGALILAAIVCVIWVLVGPENGLIGRAFLTILLLAAFAGIAILETHLAPRRPDWFALTSMVVWVATLLLGAFLIWMPVDEYDYAGGFGRFASFLAIILVLQLAVLHVRLFAKAIAHNPTGFTRATGFVTIGLVAVLAVLLVLPLTFHEFIDFDDFYWRVVVAVTILAALGTALVPLVNALFAPKRERPATPVGAYPGYGPQGYAPVGQGYAPQAYPQQLPQAYPQQAPAAQPWPTYADGVTPLPVLGDGSPDWNAYYAGHPSQPQQGAPQPAAEQAQPTAEQAQPTAEQAQPTAEQPQTPPTPQQGSQPAAPPAGYQGFPPPPPMPPQ